MGAGCLRISSAKLGVDRITDQVQLIDSAILLPSLFQRFCFCLRHDSESPERQNHGANSHVYLCTVSTKTAVWTDQNWSLYVPTASNSLKHLIQFSAQRDDLWHRHLPVPVRA